MTTQIKKANGQVVYYEVGMVNKDGRFAWTYKRNGWQSSKMPADPFGSFNKLRGYLMYNE